METMSSVSVASQIDDMIEAARVVLASDFDPVAFQQWRRRALACLTAMVGPDHVSTRHFEDRVRKGRDTTLRVVHGRPLVIED